jgi:acyl-CoA synthetase (NDP forming)
VARWDPGYAGRDLTPLLRARSVAVVGASGPERFGGKLCLNLLRFGYPGAIHLVNPRYERLFDRPCHASLRDLPERPDCALLAVPNARLAEAFAEAAACGIPAAVVFANAWSDPTAPGPPLQERLAAIARAHGMVVCGPNCMGFASLAERLVVSGYDANPETPAGRVALVSHSGSVWDALLQNRRGVAWNYIVSPGNEMVTTVADYMHFALADPGTRAIGLFLEAVRDPERFRSALELAARRDVPVVALKVGRTPRGAELARAHSGALAGEDAAYGALFERFGVRRVTSIDELMDALELFATGMRLATPFVSALLDSGGQRALLVDLAESEGVAFAPIGAATEARLREVLEPGLEATNPLDAWGTGNAAEEIYAESLQALDADPATGLSLFAVDLYPIDDPRSTYPAIAASVKDRLGKPLAWLTHASATTSEAQAAALRKMGIPVLLGTETGLRAVRHVLDYARFQRERAGRAPEPRAVPRPPELDSLRRELAAGAPALDEHASKRWLRAYGLATTREIAVLGLDEALRAAEKIGYPVVLKTAAGELHKTEHRGVRLGLASAEDVALAYRDLAERLGPRVLVQEQVPPGVELLLGIAVDPDFGPMLTVGMGGIFVEVLRDVRWLCLPPSAAEIRAALEGLRGAALLRGARGRPPVDLDAVVRAALGLAALAEDLGDRIAAVDVNPLVALPDRAVVVDALVVPRAGAGAEA